MKGQIFENMIVSECQKRDQHSYIQREYHFWQDSQGHEVDILVKQSGGFSLFEIKVSQTISGDHFKEMDRFESLAAPVKVSKTLIYGGTENEKADQIFGIELAKYFRLIPPLDRPH